MKHMQTDPQERINPQSLRTSAEHMTVKELPESERPYEKCEQYGPGVLSDAELLAVIIRSGTKTERASELAARVLQVSDSGLKGLNRLTFRDLVNIRGIGRVKAVQLLCVAELSKRMAKAKSEEKLKLSSPESVADYYMEQMRHKPREESMIVFLNARNQKIADTIVATGTVNSSLMVVREILHEALKYNAVGIILIHNHPTGDPEPSKEDIMVTKRIREGGDLVGIKVLDHIIIGDNTYVSLQERGLL